MPVNPCPLYGVHKMKAANKVSAVRHYQTEKVLSGYEFAYHSACNCGEHVICEGYPHFQPPMTTPLYNYITGAIGSTTIPRMATTNGVNTAYVNPAYIRYTS